MVAPAPSFLDPVRNASSRRGPTALLGAALGCAMLASGPADAEPRRYEIDPVHTRVWFEADHSGFSKALGTFSAPQGAVWFDAKDPSASSVEAEVPLASLDLGDEDWNERVARKDFLWSAEHPTARFRSTGVEAGDDGQLLVHGVLSIRGVDVPVTLHTQLNRAARHPLTLRRTIGFSARATLSRAAFGMTSWKRLVADPVLLRIEIEAKRKRGDGRDGEVDQEEQDLDDSRGAAGAARPGSDSRSNKDSRADPEAESNSAPASAVQAATIQPHSPEENRP